MSELLRRPVRARIAAWALATLLALPAAHGALAHDLAPCSGSGDTFCEHAGPAAHPDTTQGDELCLWCLSSSQARTLLRPAATAVLSQACPVGPFAAPAAPELPTPLARGWCASRAPPASH